MEKISDSGSFAKKFRIGGHPEFDVGVSGISGERAVEFDSRARRNRAFLDHEHRSFRFPSDLLRHVIDGGEIGVAGFLRRSANANKNGIPSANRFTGVGGVRNVPCLSGRRKNLLEVLFVNGHAACLELGNAVFINIRANDIVTRFRETGSGDQPYVSTSDDRKTQKRSSLSWSLNRQKPVCLDASLYCDRSQRKKKGIRDFLLPKQPMDIGDEQLVFFSP